MTEPDNEQTVHRLYSAFGQGDMQGIMDVLAEDVDRIFAGRPEDVPFAGHRRGREQMKEFFGIVGETVAEIYEFGPREVMSFDDKVLVLGHERVRATDRVFEKDWAHLFTVRDGKIVRLREFYDTATMAEAFRSN